MTPQNMAYVFVALSAFALVVNILWIIHNSRESAQVRNNFNLAHRMRAEAQQFRDKAVSDALEMRAGQYKLCTTCGKIVQGCCLECDVAVKG
jgi:hypothetical protein